MGQTMHGSRIIRRRRQQHHHQQQLTYESYLSAPTLSPPPSPLSSPNNNNNNNNCYYASFDYVTLEPYESYNYKLEMLRYRDSHYLHRRHDQDKVVEEVEEENVDDNSCPMTTT